MYYYYYSGICCGGLRIRAYDYDSYYLHHLRIPVARSGDSIPRNEG